MALPNRKAKTNKELTVRQVSIIKMAADGLSNEEIASALDLRINTVKWHMYMIFTAVGIKRREQLDKRRIKSIPLNSKILYYYE